MIYWVNNKIKLITPPRKYKNRKKGLTRFCKEKLKGRFIVEHSFSWAMKWKHYGRLFRRKDKTIKMFKSFIIMGACNIIAKKISEFIIG